MPRACVHQAIAGVWVGSKVEQFGRLTDVSSVRTLARLSRMLENACSDLTLPQYRLLAMVAEGDERASALAGRLALAKPTITGVVAGVVERGRVRRDVVRSDRRAAKISITAAGKRALAATEHDMNDRFD